jgi:thiol-disulfide isomerase/thioredoxin
MRRYTSLWSFFIISICMTGLTTAQTPAPTPQSKPAAPSSGPADPKARETFFIANEWEKISYEKLALNEFLKANKQDGGHCWECLNRAYLLAVKLNDYKEMEEIARNLLPLAQSTSEKSAVHYRLAMALQQQGIYNKKDKLFTESSNEFKAALQIDPEFAEVHYYLGITLAHLHQDDAAHAEFSAFLDQDRKNLSLHPRATHFMDRMDMARAIMAPSFSLTTLDGQHLSMDGLSGKVVLIDFWATWCVPCVKSLPKIKKIAQEFDGQPLVVLSISLDGNEAAWKDFVAKKGMTWLQYRDGGFKGRISTQFGVKTIPAVYTIDADGVLEDQHVGDADIEGKLKKLIARAAEANRKALPAVSTDNSASSPN